MNRSPRRIPQGLLLGPLLGVTFLAFSYIRLIGDSQTALFDHAAYQAVFEGSILGTRLAELIGWFVAAQLLIHVVLGLGCWAMARLTLIAFPGTTSTPRALTAFWFIIAALWLLFSNAGNFPHSSLGAPYAGLAGTEILNVRLHSWITGLVLLGSGFVLARALVKQSKALPLAPLRRHAAWGAVPLVAVACAAAWPEGKIAPAPADKPNIILLGIDSLRYDETQLPGNASDTPHLDEFLVDAVRLENSTTPLARTFPSWVSLLTGRHPHSTGAILNLLPQDAMRLGATLPEILRQNGYHTAYAIDEVRFSNIDEKFGFDQTETPGIGAADFILGAASDTPLVNSIVNTSLGKWLFSYCYANRANSHNYDPQTFVTRVTDDIEYRSPMLLAAHLTLPHWPYKWRNSPDYTNSPGDPDAVRPRFYVDAVRRADQQFGDILDSLEERGVLDNAIVIAFSDHGETFGSQHDMLTPPGPEVLPSSGHGTTVLAPHQYRVFFAIRGYGSARANLGGARGAIEIPASLEDVTPTVLDLLNVPANDPVDGVSLLPELRQGLSSSPRLARRIRFTETEFNPRNLVNIADPDAKVSASSLAEAAVYYRVDPETGRLEMKSHLLDELRRNRQYAAIGWTQMLGIFPRSDLSSHTFIAIDLGGGTPRPLRTAEDFQGDPEIAELWLALCNRYGAIINTGDQQVHCDSPAG